MNVDKLDDEDAPRRVRICRPAFQDMHYLVMPRMSARAQLRRYLMNLQFWRRGSTHIGDLECYQIEQEELFVVRVADGFGLADGFHIVFCELPIPEPEGTLCILSTMRNDEPFTDATLNILRGRAVIAGERLRGTD